MSEKEKLIAKIAAQLLAAAIENSGLSGDMAHSTRALMHAKNIVKGATQ